MTANDLISDLAARGVQLSAAGSRLRFCPIGRLTAADLNMLRQHKATILQLLRSEGAGIAPIVGGHEHWNPYIVDPCGPWGEEFTPGYHIDFREAGRLRPLCSPASRRGNR